MRPRLDGFCTHHTCSSSLFNCLSLRRQGLFIEVTRGQYSPNAASSLVGKIVNFERTSGQWPGMVVVATILVYLIAAAGTHVKLRVRSACSILALRICGPVS